MVENCSQEMHITDVNWKPGTSGWWKLNTGGSTLNRPGKIGGGGILRDHQESMLFAFTIPLGFGTNNQAEIQGAC